MRGDRFPEARKVVLLDPDRIEASLPPIDERTPCVLLTHHFVHDRRILEFLLGSLAPYIGLLGPRRRAERLLAEIDAALRIEGRLHGPTGLDLGA